MHTFEANRVAVSGHAKAVREALKRLGMRRCSVRLVNYQCGARDGRLDWYGLFWRWFLALWHSHRAGAEFLYEDFRGRVHALQARDAPARGDWYEQVAACEEEHAQAVKAAILNRDDAAIRREIAEDIAAKRRLLALHEARTRLTSAA